MARHRPTNPQIILIYEKSAFHSYYKQNVILVGFKRCEHPDKMLYTSVDFGVSSASVEVRSATSKLSLFSFSPKLVGKIKQGVNGSTGWYSSETNGSVQKVYISEEVFVSKKATAATF